MYRPVDAKDFNGTVMVEWHNVSSGLDARARLDVAHDELIREGDAWVGVTAQQRRRRGRRATRSCTTST